MATFKIHFPNFGYARPEEYPSFDAAVKAARGFGFEALIGEREEGQTLYIASWSPIGGLRRPLALEVQ